MTFNNTISRAFSLLAAMVALSTISFCQEVPVTGVDNHGGNAIVSTGATDTEVTVTELDSERKPVRSWTGRTDGRGQIVVPSGSNLSKGYLKVVKAGGTVEGFIVPSQVSDKEPFTFSAQGVVEGEVIEVKTVEGEVVQSMKADKYGRVFLAAGLSAGSYLLTSSHGGSPRTQTIRVNPTIADPRSVGLPFQPLAKVDRPVAVNGALFDGNAVNDTAMLGGVELPVLAESRSQAVLASPSAFGCRPGHTTLTIRDNETGAYLVSKDIALCQVQVQLAKKTLVSGESTVLEFSMEPKDIDTKIDAQIIDGPIHFSGGQNRVTIPLTNGTGSVPIETVLGQSGRFHIGWAFSPDSDSPGGGPIGNDPPRPKDEVLPDEDFDAPVTDEHGNVVNGSDGKPLVKHVHIKHVKGGGTVTTETYPGNRTVTTDSHPNKGDKTKTDTKVIEPDGKGHVTVTETTTDEDGNIVSGHKKKTHKDPADNKDTTDEEHVWVPDDGPQKGHWKQTR